MRKGITNRATATVLLAAGLAVGSTAPAIAQGDGQSRQGQTMPRSQGQDVKTDWSDARLDSFAEATVAIAKIRGKWRQKLDNAENEEERKEILGRYKDAANQAVKDAGLSPDTYNRIHKAARQDKGLSNKIGKRIQEKREKPGKQSD